MTDVILLNSYCNMKHIFSDNVVYSFGQELEQDGHGTGKTGKTGNLVLTFSRQGKHREFCSDTGKNLLTQGKYLDCDY